MKKRWILILCFAAAALPGGELVGHWLFNEGTGKEVKDTVGGRRAVLVRLDDASRWTAGRSGHAVHFGGSHDKRNTSGAAVVKWPAEFFTKPFTVEMWLKLDAGAPLRSFKDLLGNGSDRGPGFRITSFYGSIQVRSGDGTRAAAVATNPSTAVIPENSWFLLTVVYDGANAKIHINGVEHASAPIVLTAAPTVNVSLGSNLGGGAYPMGGSCDELAVYNYPLSRDEVIRNYLKGL
mgnify:CR=1 FL=1|jgi:hypothetical protein